MRTRKRINTLSPTRYVHTQEQERTRTHVYTLCNTIRTHAGTCRKEHAHTHARQSQRQYTRREQRCHIFSHLRETLPKMVHWQRRKISTHRRTHTLYSVLNLQIHVWIHTSFYHTQWHHTMPLSLFGGRESVCFCPLGACLLRHATALQNATQLKMTTDARQVAYACSRVLPLWALRHSSRVWRWAASRRPSFETSWDRGNIFTHGSSDESSYHAASVSCVYAATEYFLWIFPRIELPTGKKVRTQKKLVEAN